MDDRRKDHPDPKRTPQKGIAPNNYSLTTCLPLIWKILTAQIKGEIYYSLISRGLLPEEQKGCHKGTGGTRELQYIDPHIFKENKTRQKNAAMAWIDYKKAYDIVTQSWIIDGLKMYKISNKVIENNMENWRMELTAGGKSLAAVKIQRGIFQGDALLPLIFVIAIMPFNHIFRKCSGGYKLRKSQEKYQPSNLYGQYQTVCQK